MSDDGYSDGFDEPNMEIQIETLLGTSFDMRCSSTDTIREIKQRIQRVEGIPVHQQNLIFQSKELKDSRRLCDVDIKNGSTIKLVTSMKGGPISTRRVSVSCEHHVMLKELRELLENTRDEMGDKLAPGSKVSILVFKEGDILNLLRVIENEDGSYSPYSDKPISPPSRSGGRKESQSAIFEKLVEDSDMMTKITNLRKKMEDVSIRRQLRGRVNGEDELEVELEPSISYKLLAECSNDILDSIDLKIFEKSPTEEGSQSESEEVALKDKHRIKPNRRPVLKSLFSESRDARQRRRKRDSDEGGAKTSRGTVHLTRLVLSGDSDRPKSRTELEENADLWEISEPASDRLKHSATCKVGVLKRRQSLDYGFDTTPPSNQGNFVDSDFGNFFMPQLVSSSPSAIPPQYTPKDCDYFYNRSPLYGRNKLEPVPTTTTTTAATAANLPEVKAGFLGECSTIQRLKNDSLFGDDELYGYYNLGCATSDLLGESGGATKELPPVIKKKSRCGECNKRLNITNIYNCRCGKIFCSQHRYSEVHRCSYDYKSEGRRILEHQNPLVTAEKIHRI